MKHRLFAFFCAFVLVLSACAPAAEDVGQDVQGTAQEAGTEDGTSEIAVFVPDAQAEYLTGAYVNVPAQESLPEMLLSGLIAAGVLTEEVSLLDCQFSEDGSECRLDLNSAYLSALEAGGSAGEAMLLYSVVNTFLFNYPEVTSLRLTVDGKAVETEHGSYREPFTEMMYLRQ